MEEKRDKKLRKRSGASFLDIGIVGRKTGISLQPELFNSEDELDNVDDLFQNASKQTFQKVNMTRNFHYVNEPTRSSPRKTKSNYITHQSPKTPSLSPSGSGQKENLHSLPRRKKTSRTSSAIKSQPMKDSNQALEKKTGEKNSFNSIHASLPSAQAENYVSDSYHDSESMQNFSFGNLDIPSQAENSYSHSKSHKLPSPTSKSSSPHESHLLSSSQETLIPHNDDSLPGGLSELPTLKHKSMNSPLMSACLSPQDVHEFNFHLHNHESESEKNISSSEKRPISKNPQLSVKAGVKQRKTASRKKKSAPSTENSEDNELTLENDTAEDSEGLEKNPRKPMAKNKNDFQTEHLNKVRKSQRQRHNPLAYWRNERIFYDPFRENTHVVAGNSDNFTEAESVSEIRPKKKTKAKASTKKITNPQNETEIQPSPENPSDNIQMDQHPISKQKPSTKHTLEGNLKKLNDLGFVPSLSSTAEVLGSDGSLITKEVLRTEEMMTFKAAKKSKPGCSIAKAFNCDTFTTGMLLMEPSAEKSYQDVGDSSLLLYVVNGICEFKVHETTFFVSAGSQCAIPSHSGYSLKNLSSDTPLKFFFCQVKVPATW